MRERPILMSGLMARATLEGLKTQTRRASGLEHVNEAPDAWTPVWSGPLGERFAVTFQRNDTYWTCFCPYGRAGDRLWVRETWAEDGRGYTYRATNETWPHHWAPSIFMPRRACRLLLDVLDVRVERLQDITEADRHAEGFWPDQGYGPAAFADYWDQLNAKRDYSWERNLWVWVISYKRVVS